ncbi:MAG TPA: DUF202 domain-containing protein [Ktedonobacterales bacterium]|nr:DUF202 domain-containing protein [Ktedonobacterales bacterium]
MTIPRTSPDDSSEAAPTRREPDDASGDAREAGAGAGAPRGQGRLSDHLANQRTLLAWARTGVSIMALGFVVARFGLLIRELGSVHGHTLPSGAASWFGIVLTLFGAALVGLSLVRYLRIARGIDEGAPRTSPELDISMAVGLVLAGLTLALYLALTR